MAREKIDLEGLIDFGGFDYETYYEGETKILQPQLEKLGYQIIRWYSIEFDSFGPLVRAARAIKDDTEFLLIYE